MNHPRDKSRLEMIRDAELSTGKAFVCKTANATLATTRMPARQVNCPCGHVWIGHPILDAPGNLCPRCQRGASENHAGPLIYIDVTNEINLAANGTPEA